MKPIFAVVALLGLFDRCQSELIVPHQHEPAGSTAGSGTPRDAGVAPDDAAVAQDAAATDPDASAPAPSAACSGPPGLYADADCRMLNEGVTSYTPRFELWSDGEHKERFIYLPAGTRIDTADPDRWNFPLGTRVYKTFMQNGKKLETRMMEKTAAAAGVDSWVFTAYAWSDDQRSVSAADAAGATGVLGTTHDIPSQAQCKSCHTMTGLDAINGFGAIQLNHADSGWTLAKLLEAELLVNGAGAEPNVDLEHAIIPGDEVAQAGLGYLHGNCGHCHGGPSPRAGMALWSLVGTASVADTPAAQTAGCQCLQRWTGRMAGDGSAYLLRIAPGDAAHSGVIGRMRVRGAGEQMPPIGTKLVDDEGVAAVSAFIDALDPAGCSAVCGAAMK